VLSCAARALCRTVELAGLLVEGGSLLDGAEAGDAEGLTGLGDGLGPAADVLVRLSAGGELLLGDDLAGLVHHQVGLGVAGVGVVAGAVPDLAAGSADANATSHFRVGEFVRAASTKCNLQRDVTVFLAARK